MEYQSQSMPQQSGFPQVEIPQPNVRKKWFNFDKYMFGVGIFGQSLFFWHFVKIIENGSAGDVSLPGFSITLFSLVNWLIYGIIKKDKVVIFANVVGSFGALLTVGSIVYVTYIGTF